MTQDEIQREAYRRAAKETSNVVDSFYRNGNPMDADAARAELAIRYQQHLRSLSHDNMKTGSWR